MAGHDEKYMLKGLQLAKRGVGAVEPNPAVGCVIVKNGRIIGKGWHKKFGGPHAEVNAIEDCKSRGEEPADAVMYVTLEPCCHHGKTGPCTEVIIKAKLARVIVAMVDPSEHAGGKSIEQLRKAGIEVHVGVCEEQAKLLNAPFIKYAATGKTWVILKWAQSIDGFLAWSQNGKLQKWISGEKSRKDAHKLRRRTQGILVGINTVLADNPQLTPRPAKGKKPLRIVLDSKLRIPLDCNLIKTAKKSPVLIITTEAGKNTNLNNLEKITKAGAEVLIVPQQQDRCSLAFVLDELGRRGIAQLLVEGGAEVITSFLEEKLADEICVYIAPKILGSMGKVNLAATMARLDNLKLCHVDIKQLDDDVRLSGLLSGF